jgi:hypothetical protein
LTAVIALVSRANVEKRIAVSDSQVNRVSDFIWWESELQKNVRQRRQVKKLFHLVPLVGPVTENRFLTLSNVCTAIGPVDG